MDPEAIYEALLEPAGMDDPYPLYAALHEHGPVVAAGDGLVLLSGYDVVNAVLRDPEYLVDDAEIFDRGFPDWRDHSSLNAEGLLSLNGADHARIRTLFARTFTHRRVQALEPAIIRLTDELLEKLADRGAGGPVDVMQEFAFALPVAVIGELIGASGWDASLLRPLARNLMAVLEPEIDEVVLADGDAAASTLTEMFTDLVSDRRRSPREDLASALVAVADVPGAPISESELIQNLLQLLVAGFECSTSMLGNGLRIALTHPEIAAGLRTGSVAAGAFVEEVLRYDPPVQDTGRRKQTSGELHGVPVDSDDELVLLIGAANRDPRRFAAPDEFRPDRTDGGSLSFGAGAHFCLGAALARMEGAIAFPRLLRRFPALAAAGQPERRPGATSRCFQLMPVSLERASGPSSRRAV